MRAVQFTSFSRLASVTALALGLFASQSASAAKLDAPLVFSAHDNSAYITQAFDSNADGTVVGYYYDANYNAFGFIRKADGTYTDIVYPAAPTATFPRAINDKGVVVGQGNIDGWGQGFLYNIEKNKFKPVEVPGAKSTYAESINNKGVIAGYTYFYPDPSRVNYFTVSGFTLKDGEYKLIDVPGALYTYIRSINDKGVVAGNYTDATTFASHSFLMQPDGTVEVVDAKNSINHASTIFGISKKGDSVGTCTDSSFTNFGCLHIEATGATTQFSAPGLTSASPWSLKNSLIVGFGYNSGIGKNMGFVINKSAATNP